MKTNEYINFESLERLKDSAQGVDKNLFVLEIIDLFLNHCPSSMKTLQSSLLEQVPVRVRRSAHKLRGLSLNVGAVRLAEVCGHIESIRIPMDEAKLQQTLVELHMIATKTTEDLSKVREKFE